MRKCVICLVILPFFVVGCASTGPKIVRVPVPTSCAPETLPAEPPKVAGNLTGNAERDIGIIAASALRLRAWGKELEAILKGCKAQ
jgi:hypothetical protein